MWRESLGREEGLPGLAELVGCGGRGLAERGCEEEVGGWVIREWAVEEAWVIFLRGPPNQLCSMGRGCLGPCVGANR